ncbi:MAG: glycosyltransferase family 2 protein [Sandaracinaceae bacterium]
MSAPRVDVMMPCYEAADTVRLALASLRAQSLQDWRCLIVDDGSSDETYALLDRAAADDGRFEVHRFDQNRGRGVARQFLLEKVTAPLVAFLDADDWMYPDRLTSQVTWMDLEPSLAAVGSPMVIFDDALEIVGEASPRVASPLPAILDFARPEPPPFSFPSSMLRSELVARAGFDPALRRSQDSDMLIRALVGHRYALTSRPLYAYRRAAMTVAKTLEGYRYRMVAHRKHLRSHPLRVGKTLAATFAKGAVFRTLAAFGAHETLLSARYSTPSAATTSEYHAARATIRTVEEQMWAA